jgi:hypothetical protein
MSTNLKKQIILHIDSPSGRSFNKIKNKRNDIFVRSQNGQILRDLKSLDFTKEIRLDIPRSFSIEIADMNPKEILDAHDDPNRILAPPLPLHLIHPLNGQNYKQEETPFSNTWGVETTLAHQSPFNGEGVKIAILDTGINSEHLAFQGVKLKLKNFTQDVNEDIHGHGTHCAGTIFGRDIDGLRIGVAPGITDALIAKVIGVGGTSGSLVEAIDWAYKEGANLISMSLGIDFTTYIKELTDDGYTIEAATSYALEQYLANVNMFSVLNDLIQAKEKLYQPCTIIAASGNSSNRPHYEVSASVPATSENVISVGALAQIGKTFSIAPFSNDKCKIAAPGVNITSAWIGSNDALRSLDGTSMAAPHVTGCAALWIQKLKQQNNFSSVMLQAKLLGSAKYIPTIASKDIGSGLVQAPL